MINRNHAIKTLIKTYKIFACICILTLQAFTQTFDRGYSFTSKGTVKALTIFIQFPGDTTHRESTEWPINQAPVFLNTFLDSTANQTSTPWSFSDYFKEMSFDALKFYGKGYFVIAPHTERYYIDTLGYKWDEAYGRINRDVLNMLDSQINYAEYDNWTFGLTTGVPYSHTNTPDDVVDLIIVLYRNSVWPPGEPVQGTAQLGESDSLDGKHIYGWFPGSGITNSGGYAGMKRCALSMKHEFGHLLLGSHPEYSNHNHHGYAADGMSGILMGQGNVATGWERERLGWINYTNVTANQSYSLTDFVTTGKVLKISIPGTDPDEAFLIQNHQKLSIYDDPNLNRPGKGIFIYHISGMTADAPTYDVEVAEGKYSWSVPYWHNPGWGGETNPFSLPVFKQGIANPNGWDTRDWLPTDKPLTVNPFTNVNWCAFFFSDNNGRPQLVDRYRGDPKDIYDVGYNQIFSPWSNPNSNSWNNTPTSIAVEITGKHPGLYGEDIYDLKVCVNNPEQVSPSKPINVQAFRTTTGNKVFWNANSEPNIQGYDVYCATYYRGGPLNYTKHNSSPVTSASYLDQESQSRPPYDTVYYRYHVKAINNGGKSSLPSEDFWLNYQAPVTNVGLITLLPSTPLGSYKINNLDVGITWTGGIPLGQPVTIEAVGPDYTWMLLNWSDGSTQNPKTFTPNGDVTMSAVFRKKIPFAITLNQSTYVEGVSIGYEVDGTPFGTHGNILCLEGDIVKIKAQSSSECYFLRWNDGDTATTKVVTNNITLSAVYKMHLGSSISTATSPNGQRKMMKDTQNKYHAVYESGEEIWYTTTTNWGTTWSPELNLSNGSTSDGTNNANPSISYYVTAAGLYRPIVAWEIRSNVYDGFKIAVRWMSADGTHWENAVSIPNAGMYDGPFAYPCIAYPYVFFCKPYGIYYSKSVVSSGSITGFTETVKINGTSSSSENLSACSQGDVGHVVWAENGAIKYCQVVSGAASSIETIVAYDGTNHASFPCITAQFTGFQWIAWQSRDVWTSKWVIKTRRRVGIDVYSSIQTFSAGDGVNCRPSISSYLNEHPGIVTKRPPYSTGSPPRINDNPWYLIPFGHDFGVSIAWDYNGTSVKKVTYTNGSWEPIETLRNAVYQVQLCSKDGWYKYPGLALFSSLQGPRYSLISHPYVTKVPTMMVLHVGWNLVSVPRVQADYTASVLFPDIYGVPMGYDATSGDYAEAPILELGKAYWVYYPKADTITFSGATAADINIPCKKGWNLIGSRDVSMLPTELRLSAGCIYGCLFKYDPEVGDYVEAPMLIPGLGTWIFLSQDCILTIPVPYILQ